MIFADSFQKLNPLDSPMQSPLAERVAYDLCGAAHLFIEFCSQFVTNDRHVGVGMISLSEAPVVHPWESVGWLVKL